MDGKQIQETAIRVARAQPLAELCYPFGPEYEVFRVRGKIFALMTRVRGEKIVNLKCDPENALLQRAIYSSIHAAWHMNKRHWISVYAGEEITEGLIRQLVEESCDLVVAGLPKKQRPVVKREI